MKSLALATLALAALLTTVSAADAPPAAAQLCTSLLTAIATNDLAAFQKDGNDAFRSGITKPMFETVSAQLAPIFKDGYESEFLTSLKQRKLDVYLWKITPKTGNDQFVAKLVLEDGKVAGFWIN